MHICGFVTVYLSCAHFCKFRLYLRLNFSQVLSKCWAGNTTTVFAYTEHLRAGADPGETAASTATSEHPSSMAGVRESPSASSATTVAW